MRAFFMKLSLIWWCLWSSVRFAKQERFFHDVATQDKIKDNLDIIKLAKRVYSKFKYTQDDISQLWDAIVPPPQNYLNYRGGIIEDDCDGFHSAVYHVLANSHIIQDCYLMAVTAKECGHCVVVYRFDNKWYVLDYKKLYQGFDTLKEAYENYNKDYSKKYNAPSGVYYNGFVKYNYNKGVFYLVDISKIQQGEKLEKKEVVEEDE